MNDNHFHLDSPPRFLIGISGSIAATHAPAYLDALRNQFGGSYTAVMTHSATQFISPQILRLSAERVVCGDDPRDWPTDRPSRLAGDHDLAIVLPATAHVMGAVANGLAPNRLTTVIMAMSEPGIFVPHMGTAMWEKPAVRRNVAQLRADGHLVIEPAWVESHDIVTGHRSRHPAVPAPAELINRLGEVLRLTPRSAVAR